MVEKKDEFIKFPSDEEELNLVITRMKIIPGLLNVVGAIDGSQVQIKAPKLYHKDYFSRKQNYSVNLQGTGFVALSAGLMVTTKGIRLLFLGDLSHKLVEILFSLHPN